MYLCTLKIIVTERSKKDCKKQPTTMFKNFNGIHLVDAYHKMRQERKSQPARVMKKAIEAIVVAIVTLILFYKERMINMAKINLLLKFYLNAPMKSVLKKKLKQ